MNGEENGILFKPKQVGPVELATTAFGQGVSVTPIQQIAAVSAAINGGKLYKPHVAKAWINPDTGQAVSEIQPEMERQVITEETSRKVREALESVVAKGTGRPAFIDGYRVGGKTGTAQKSLTEDIPRRSISFRSSASRLRTIRKLSFIPQWIIRKESSLAALWPRRLCRTFWRIPLII